MKTRTIEDWRVTQLFVELEKRVAENKECAQSVGKTSHLPIHNFYRGRWYESEYALALVRSFLEESEDIEACMERLKNE
jgi:hypothetical protein